MVEKKFYKSKGTVGGILIVIGGVVTAVGQLLTGNLDFGSFFGQVVPLVGTGLGIVGLRDKQGEIKWK